MAFLTQVPTNPTILTVTADVAASLASAFRPNINAAKNTLDSKAQLVQAFLEQMTAQFGNGAVSGGTISIGTGLSVNIALLSAIVGNAAAFDASQVVGGLTASVTNYLFLRQDGTWTIPAAGSSTPPLTTDGHGAYLLWGTATTSGVSVTSVSNVRRMFGQAVSVISIVAADPASPAAGDEWFRSDTLQHCVFVGGVVRRSAAYT